MIQFGANIGFEGLEVVCPCKNLKSAFLNCGFIGSSIETLLSCGHLQGPFLTPPLPSLQCSPLGVVTHKCSSKLHMINHLSWPEGSSANDGIADSEDFISYDMFECAVEDLIMSGPGSLMAKLDLKDAFTWGCPGKGSFISVSF